MVSSERALLARKRIYSFESYNAPKNSDAEHLSAETLWCWYLRPGSLPEPQRAGARGLHAVL